MKNIGLTTFALLALLATDSAAQQVGVRINEIQLHAASTSSVAQQIELKNHTNSAVDLTGYQLVTGGGQTALPGLLLSGGHTVVLHLGVSGTDTATDLFLPTAATLVPPDAISLFRSPAVTQPGELMDFVSFGGGHQGIAMAVTAGQWPSSQATVPLPPSGASLAHFDEVVYGSPDRPEAWFVDGTPTLGASNDGGGVFLAESGCPGLAPYPYVGSGEDDNRPWIGETWLLDALFLPPTPSTMWLAIGDTYTGPSSLAYIGMPNCMTAFAPYAIQAHALAANQDQMQFTIPDHAALVGMRFYLQGLVTGYPGLNAAGLAATRVLRAYVGSR